MMEAVKRRGAEIIVIGVAILSALNIFSSIYLLNAAVVCTTGRYDDVYSPCFAPLADILTQTPNSLVNYWGCARGEIPTGYFVCYNGQSCVEGESLPGYSGGCQSPTALLALAPPNGGCVWHETHLWQAILKPNESPILFPTRDVAAVDVKCATCDPISSASSYASCPVYFSDRALPLGIQMLTATSRSNWFAGVFWMHVIAFTLSESIKLCGLMSTLCWPTCRGPENFKFFLNSGIMWLFLCLSMNYRKLAFHAATLRNTWVLAFNIVTADVPMLFLPATIVYYNGRDAYSILPIITTVFIIIVGLIRFTLGCISQIRAEQAVFDQEIEHQFSSLK